MKKLKKIKLKINFLISIFFNNYKISFFGLLQYITLRVKRKIVK